ncbi:Malonyltransferase [Heracleum sosnowskyi]|uniref:Malonyltransferase n=1 Tax=Heracleum sosnowskyi TaxID=360622 RepID=A0AAD8IWU2_9APIA|nr:Malonyltransferase [Heracleum sosnowskyi]
MANAVGTNTVTVLEHCRISPSLDHSVTEKLLPLTFFDLLWLNWPSLSRVYFYDLPCSTTKFKQTLVPHLKKSLALTLKHYFPFCGNVIIPTTLSNNTGPAIRYLEGDSVSLAIAEFSSTSSKGLEHLSANHARDIDELFSLIPELPPGDTDTIGDDVVQISPVLSVQVTLFPDQGFSVGFRNSHLVADGKTMCNFIATWASINAKQLNGEDDYDSMNTLPFYDRSVINDPKKIGSIFLKFGLRMAEEFSKAPAPTAHKIDLVQATIKINRAQIQGLKDLVLAKLPHVSTFIVVCAYAWTCMAKASISIALGQGIGNENEVEEHFILAIDTRARLDPPIPSNYLGNAVTPGVTTLKTSRLVGQEGFVYAAEEIKKSLHEQINNEEGVLKGLDVFFDFIEGMKGQKNFGVAGSPKFNYYGTDFGWGKPKKYDVVSEKFALVGSRDSDGGLEIGLCLSKSEMDAFTAIFIDGLIN